jgi:hypothetical protein
MRALTYHGTRDVRVDNVPDPSTAATCPKRCAMTDGRGPAAYETFQKKQDGAFKVLLQP